VTGGLTDGGERAAGGRLRVRCCAVGVELIANATMQPLRRVRSRRVARTLTHTRPTAVTHTHAHTRQTTNAETTTTMVVQYIVNIYIYIYMYVLLL